MRIRTRPKSSPRKRAATGQRDTSKPAHLNWVGFQLLQNLFPLSDGEFADKLANFAPLLSVRRKIHACRSLQNRHAKYELRAHRLRCSGIRLEIFDGKDGSQPLYAAQVALRVHREAKGKNHASPRGLRTRRQRPRRAPSRAVFPRPAATNERPERAAASSLRALADLVVNVL